MKLKLSGDPLLLSCCVLPLLPPAKGVVASRRVVGLFLD